MDSQVEPVRWSGEVLETKPVVGRMTCLSFQDLNEGVLFLLVLMEEHTGDEREDVLLRGIDNLVVPALKEWGLFLKSVVEIGSKDSSHVVLQSVSGEQ